MKKWYFIVLLGITGIVACENTEESPQPAPPKVEDVNPNGSSELALLMRQMHTSAAKAKAALQSGEVPEITVDYSAITTAMPTDASMVDFEGFLPLAKGYTAAMASLQSATDSASAATAYMQMINTCLACHQQSCRGPIPRIRKLKLQDRSDN